MIKLDLLVFGINVNGEAEHKNLRYQEELGNEGHNSVMLSEAKYL
jgi:hypothetical protein